MSELQTDSIEALLALVDLAQGDIAEASSSFSEQGRDGFADLCAGHLETIGWASDMAGLARLSAITNALLVRVESDKASLNAEAGAELVNWLNDVQFHLAAPDDPDTVSLLLNPLGEDAQSELLQLWDAQSDDTSAEFPREDFPQEDSPQHFDADDQALNRDVVPAQGSSEKQAFIDAGTIATGDAREFDTSGMLGMLASELNDATPELDQLAKTICETEDAATLRQAIAAYQDIVARILAVADELGLEGLTQVCLFVTHNTTLLQESSAADRQRACEVLPQWPGVIIEHLVQPRDDALCLAVVDFLEIDSWPEALPYRQVRELIDGLTSELEISGESMVEKREVEALAEDVSLEMSDDVSPELIEAFFAESPGHAESLSHLMEAIASGDDIQQNVESAQRIAHTLKGSGNLVGARGVATLAHHVEDIFEYIAKQKMRPPQALADTMQEAADTIESMLEYMQGVAPEPEDAQAVLQKVLNWANRIDQGNIRLDDFDAESPVAQRRARLETDTAELPEGFADRRNNGEAPDTPTPAASSTAAETVRVPLDVLDNMFRVVSETAIAIGQIQEHLNRLDDSDKMIRKNDSDLQQRRYELENLVSIRGMAAQHRIARADNDADFDPLEMDVYDEFYGATHAYIEGVADSRHILREFTTEVSELNSLFLLQQRLNKELQEVIMTTRMVPVSTISARLQRSVRQVCRATGKQAELSVSGEDLMLDGDVLNKLADPLMHMLRNAVDHGIEIDAERAAANKPRVGRITLQFRQQGNSVVVDCADDGVGLNYERIRSTAIRHGLIDAQDTPTNQALARMILQSGFSTSDKVTQVSGRGVGMDVVNNTIQALKGSMEISDGSACGTLVTLRLPITLLTSHCLLVGVGSDETYAIPTTALTQILSPGTGKLGRVGNNITYQLGKEVYTTYSLDSLLGKPGQGVDEKLAERSVMLVQTAEGIKAVTVDRVVSSYDLVLKNMGAYVKSLAGVAGVSILGDGSVVTVLDLPSLLEHRDSRGQRSQARLSPSHPAAEVALLPKVLIVDDSLSVRSSLSQLMSDGGYRVVTARDGLEAVNMLEAEAPDIVLTDLEMPRMNGLDLVGYIRNSSQWKPLPVVMITSRTMAKHREQAERAGVNSYITKPFTEDEVLASIDRELAPSAAG
jgi:chemosensory pili system protein ChpA (sensor histidine kinase/response regulator)